MIWCSFIVLVREFFFEEVRVMFYGYFGVLGWGGGLLAVGCFFLIFIVFFGSG